MRIRVSDAHNAVARLHCLDADLLVRLPLPRLVLLVAVEVLQAVPEHQQPSLDHLRPRAGLLGKHHDVDAGTVHLLVKAGPHERLDLVHKAPLDASNAVCAQIAIEPVFSI